MPALDHHTVVLLTTVVRHWLVVGPRDTAAQLAVIAGLAGWLRELGQRVTTPQDIARVAGQGWGSVAYARAKAEALLDADAVVLVAGWEDCPHSAATHFTATTYGLPVYCWDESPPVSLAAALQTA